MTWDRSYRPKNARYTGYCFRCTGKARVDWCVWCKNAAYGFERQKAVIGAVIVIDLTAKEIRFERKTMRDVSNKKGEENKFPATLEFKDSGEGFVLLGKQIRTNVETRYGVRTVVECVERQTKQLRSVWWPQGIPVPSLALPFMLIRLSKRDWKLVTCDTREEAIELWQTGEVKNPIMNAGDAGADFA